MDAWNYKYGRWEKVGGKWPPGPDAAREMIPQTPEAQELFSESRRQGLSIWASIANGLTATAADGEHEQS